MCQAHRQAQYRVLLHLKEDRRDRPLSDLFGYSARFFKEQKFALLVTGIRPHQPGISGISGISDRMRSCEAGPR